MSIEALLQAQIDALKENTKAVLLLEASLVGRASGKPKEELAKQEKPKVEAKSEVKEEKKREAEPIVSQATIDEVAAVQEQLAAEREAREATSYETLRELVLKLASGGKRAEIQEVSKKHGLNAPKDLLKDASDMTSVTDQAKLEAVYTDLLALEA